MTRVCARAGAESVNAQNATERMRLMLRLPFLDPLHDVADVPKPFREMRGHAGRHANVVDTGEIIPASVKGDHMDMARHYPGCAREAPGPVGPGSQPVLR